MRQKVRLLEGGRDPAKLRELLKANWEMMMRLMSQRRKKKDKKTKTEEKFELLEQKQLAPSSATWELLRMKNWVTI